MKKKLLTLLLLAPSLGLSTFEEDETHFVNPSAHTYVLKNGERIPLETIIDPNALVLCLIHDNVEKFKMIEENQNPS